MIRAGKAQREKTKEETSTQEKLIAPIILIITLLLSYAVILFSK